MKSCQNRTRSGVVDPVTLVVIAVFATLVVAGGGTLKSAFSIFSSDSKQKQEAVVLTTDVAATQKAQAEADAARAQAAAVQAALDAQKKERQDTAHGFVVGAQFALAKEAKPSLNVVVASTLLEDAHRAMDPLGQAQIDEMQNLVARLTSENLAIRAQAQDDLQAKQVEIDQEKVKEASLSQALEQKEVAVKTLSDTAAKLQTQTVEDSKSLAKWASDNQTLLQKVKTLTLWLLVFGAVYFVAFWVLPAAATFFPPLAPFAKAIHAAAALPAAALHKVELLASQAAHAVTQAKLEASTAAHAATTAALATVAVAAATQQPPPAK